MFTIMVCSSSYFIRCFLDKQLSVCPAATDTWTWDHGHIWWIRISRCRRTPSFRALDLFMFLVTAASSQQFTVDAFLQRSGYWWQTWVQVGHRAGRRSSKFTNSTFSPLNQNFCFSHGGIFLHCCGFCTDVLCWSTPSAGLSTQLFSSTHLNSSFFSAISHTVLWLSTIWFLFVIWPGLSWKSDAALTEWKEVSVVNVRAFFLSPSLSPLLSVCSGSCILWRAVVH